MYYPWRDWKKKKNRASIESSPKSPHMGNLMGFILFYRKAPKVWINSRGIETNGELSLVSVIYITTIDEADHLCWCSVMNL